MFQFYRDGLDIPTTATRRSAAEMIGVAPNERNPAVIEEAALLRAAAVRAYQVRYPAETTQLLNEIARAMAALLDEVAHPPRSTVAPTFVEADDDERRSTKLDTGKATAADDGRPPRPITMTAIVLCPGAAADAADEVRAWEVRIRPVALTEPQRQKWARRLKGKKDSGSHRRRPRVCLDAEGVRSRPAFEVAETTWKAFLAVLAQAALTAPAAGD